MFQQLIHVRSEHAQNKHIRGFRQMFLFPHASKCRRTMCTDIITKRDKRFVRKSRAKNVKILVNDLLIAYKKIGWRISFKNLLPPFPFLFFPSNLEALSDELGERFNQNVKRLDERFQGRWDAAMLGDYQHKRKRVEYF